MKQHATIKRENVPLTGGARARVLKVSKARDVELSKLRRMQWRFQNAPSIFGVLFMMAAAFVGGWLVHAQLAKP